MNLYRDEAGTELYDIAFDWRREKEADFVERCASEHGGPSRGALLDLACGGGQFLKEMAGRGWKVAGVDISPQMVELARSRLDARTPLEAACMSRFKLPGPFDVATCWLDSLPYLLTNEDVIRHFRRVAESLKPAGLYLLDFAFSTWAETFWHQPDADWKPDFGNGWSATRGDTVVYHDGCDGPPCDCLAHLATEYMYFRSADQRSGEIEERRYQTLKRALHPQEFAALVSASGAFELLAWYSGKFDLSETLDAADGKGRALVLLKSRRG